MKYRKILVSLAAIVAVALFGSAALAQSVLTPITQGLVWTPSQWTTAWQSKQDYPATTPIPLLSWTSTTRPGSPRTGGLGYNSTIGNIEFWNGSDWTSPGGGSGGVSQIIAGTGISVSPSGGTGNVTISAAASGPSVTAACNNAPGDGIVIQNAVNTGKSVFIQGPCVLDSTVTLTTPSQLVYGSGVNQTNLNVPTSAVSTLGQGALVINTGNPGPGPILQDFTINFAQADTASRSALTNYPPAIYAQNQTRLTMFRMKITAAMIGIDGRGNTGGWVIDDLKMSAFSVGMWFDGGGDTHRINNWHSWPFGNPAAGGSYGGTLTTNQMSIYNAANTGCTPETTSGSAGSISLMAGSGFYQITDHLTISGQGWCAFNTASGAQTGFGPIIQAANVAFDTFTGLVETGGTIQLTTSYFTLGAGNIPAVKQSGGLLNLTNDYFAQSSSTITAPVLSFTGGTENGLGTGQVANMTVTDSSFDMYGGPGQALVGNSSTGNGTINFNGNRMILNGSATYPSPVIQVTGPSTIFKASGNLASNSGLGTGAFISVGTDNWNTVIGNTAPGWVMSFPASPTEGIYACNNSNSGTACGSGGGGGVTAGTNINITGGSTVNVDTALTGITSISGLSGASALTDGSGNDLVGTSGGAAFIGNSTHNLTLNGSSGVIPGTSGLSLGSVGNPWNAFVNQLQLISITGATQCLQVNTSGIVSGTGTACGSGGGGGGTITGVTAGTNLTGGGTSGTVTLNLSSTPTVTGIGVTSNVNDGGTGCSGSACVALSWSSGQPFLGNPTHNVAFNSAGAVYPATDNAIILGESSFRWSAVWAVNGTIQTSDMRDKVKLSDETLGIEFLRCLHPFRGEWKDKPNGTHDWLSAQEVEACLNGTDFAGLHKPTDDQDRYALNYSEFIPILIKAVRDQSAEIDDLHKEMADLRRHTFRVGEPILMGIPDVSTVPLYISH